MTMVIIRMMILIKMTMSIMTTMIVMKMTMPTMTMTMMLPTMIMTKSSFPLLLQGVFFTGTPLKSSKYKKVNLG